MTKKSTLRTLEEAKQFVLDNFNIVDPIEEHFGGVYIFINKDNEIEYIGSSINIRGRLKKHHRYDPHVHRVMVYKLYDYKISDLRRIEMDLIRAFNPPLNSRGTHPIMIIEEISDPKYHKYKSLEEAQQAALPYLSESLLSIINELLEDGTLINVDGKIIPGNTEKTKKWRKVADGSFGDFDWSDITKEKKKPKSTK